MDYQILHTEFNQQLFDLLGISESQWALGVAKYNEQYRSKAGGKELERPNLKAFYALMRFIASPDRSNEAWAAVGGSGLPKAVTDRKNTLALPNIPKVLLATYTPRWGWKYCGCHT